MSDMPVQTQWSRKQHRYLSSLPIPWKMIATHDAQAMANHAGQNLVKLASRGGLSPCEAIAILEDRPWTRMDEDEAHEKLRKMIVDWSTEHSD